MNQRRQTKTNRVQRQQPQPQKRPEQNNHFGNMYVDDDTKMASWIHNLQGQQQRQNNMQSEQQQRSGSDVYERGVWENQPAQRATGWEMSNNHNFMESVAHDNFFGASSFDDQKPLEQRRTRKAPQHHYAGEDSEDDDFMDAKPAQQPQQRAPAMRPPMPQAMAGGAPTFRSQQPAQRRNANQPQYGFNGRAAQIAKDLAADYEDQMDQEDDDLLEMPEQPVETPDWYFM